MEYNFRIFLFATKNVKFVNYGSEIISYIGRKVWELLSKNIKDSDNINPLQPGVAFLYPLKTSENLKVFCFQGV